MPSIFSWKCSYYNNSTRKWIDGSLRLRVNNISFIQDDNKTENNLKVTFGFNDICEVKKATSTFVYSCVVFKLKTESIWFSSFPNRDHVFSTIEYFWKQQLCGPLTPVAGSGNYHANELLRIAHGTQDSLMEAANTLHMQGRQINNASVTMNKVHNDLTVAERVADDLDAYFSTWHVKGPPSKVPNITMEREDLSVQTDRIEYSILFASFAQESHKPGYIVLNNNNIDILNEKSISIFLSPIKHLSKIDVNSPWDVTIATRSFGKSDNALHLISMKMPNIIQTLRKVYDVELNYIDTTDVDESDDDDDDVDVGASRTDISHDSVIRTSSQGNQTQLSKEENQELSKVINNIKSMAVNISAEQDAQIQQLELLNHSVDKAHSRIKATDWKVKKLT